MNLKEWAESQGIDTSTWTKEDWDNARLLRACLSGKAHTSTPYNPKKDPRADDRVSHPRGWLQRQ